MVFETKVSCFTTIQTVVDYCQDFVKKAFAFRDASLAQLQNTLGLPHKSLIQGCRPFGFFMHLSAICNLANQKNKKTKKNA